MNNRVTKALALMMTFILTASFGGCKPIVNTTANAPHLGAGNSVSDIDLNDGSSWDFSVSSEEASSSAASSGTDKPLGGGKGSQIIVDNSDDVGSMDDPEDPQKPSNTDKGEDKPSGDTIIVKPPVSSSKPSSTQTPSKPAPSKPSGISGPSATYSSKPSNAAVSSALSSAGAISSAPVSSKPVSSAASSNTTTSSEGNTSSDTTTSVPPASSSVSSEKPPFQPPNNQWYDYEGKRYLYQNGKPVTGYQRVNGLTYFFEQDGSVSSKVGIDVSKFQGDIDWNKVKAAGVEYAIIRIGYRGYGSAGNMAKDPKFLQNLVNATSVGINCGIYFFTQAITKAEAEEEAKKVIAWLKEAKTEKDKNGNLVWPKSNWKYLNYPIYFDTELSTASPSGTGRADKLTKSQRTETVIGFCEALKKEKYYPGIYASASWLYDKLDLSKLKSYDIWVASYVGNVQNGPMVNINKGTKYTGPYKMWQYTSQGKINGISGYVDLNVGLFDYAAYISKNGWNHLNGM